MFRLKELRQKYNMKRSDLSRALDINQGTIANYENGTREAPYSTLIIFADFFNVSIDYLLGHNEPENDSKQREMIRSYILSDEEIFLVESFRMLEQAQKKKILDIYKIMLR